MKKHEEFGQPVFARAVPVRSVLEFVTLKEGTAGSSVRRSAPDERWDSTVLGRGQS
jgi:hypothetical protein